MMYKTLTLVLVLAGTMACSDAENASQPSTPPAETNGLTAAQLENGIGPITSLELTAINPELVEQGSDIYATKCAMCHKFDGRYVGPSMEGLLDRRTPEFVMNMMLNPTEMVEKHPEVKKMLAEFLTPMPNQNLTEADARAVLEYIRQVSEEGAD